MGGIRELEYGLSVFPCQVGDEVGRWRQSIVISPREWIADFRHGAVRIAVIPHSFNLDIFWSRSASRLRWQKWVYIVKDIPQDDEVPGRQLVGVLQVRGDNPEYYNYVEPSQTSSWNMDPLAVLQFPPETIPRWSSLVACMSIDLSNPNITPQLHSKKGDLEVMVPLSSKEHPGLRGHHLAVIFPGYQLDPRRAEIQLHLITDDIRSERMHLLG